jgi:hypothetical protein
VHERPVRLRPIFSGGFPCRRRTGRRAQADGLQILHSFGAGYRVIAQHRRSGRRFHDGEQKLITGGTHMAFELLRRLPFLHVQQRTRRVKLLNPTANAQADAACGSSAVGPVRRLTARHQGPRLCLSPQPHRVNHELRSPALATLARRPGGLPITSSTRAPRSGVPSAKCMVGGTSAASCATTTDTPLSAVPSPPNCRTAWGPVEAEGQARRLPW